MSFWQQVWKLVRFELRHSLKYYGFLLLTVMVLVLLLYKSIPNYMDNAFMGIDLLFILSFIYFYQFSRPKQFQLQKMSGIHYVTPVLITYNQLAIEKRVIVVYRFIVYLITNGVFSILLLLSLFPFFQPYLSPTEYLVFSVIWLAFGIYIGGANPAFETYSNVGWNIFYALIIGFILFILYTYLFYKWYPHGFVGWTIDVAINHSWIAVITSIILSGVGLVFWMKVMKRRMEKTDYIS